MTTAKHDAKIVAGRTSLKRTGIKTKNRTSSATVPSATSRVARHRAAMRAAGMRLIQFWVPDTRGADFEKECKRQSRIIAKAEANNKDIVQFMDTALNDIEGWI